MTEKLKEVIRQAFSNITLGDGIGLWESQAIDDYEIDSIRAKERKRDERESWQNLSLNDLQYANSSLSFVDAEGMRFLLPAYMLASLDPNFGFDPVYTLTQHFDVSHFKLLNSEQRNAIKHYLEWTVANPNFEFEKPHILKTLDSSWLTES